jgi:sugar lactone lactonase YvrE
VPITLFLWLLAFAAAVYQADAQIVGGSLAEPIAPGTVKWLYRPATGTTRSILCVVVSPINGDVFFGDSTARKIFKISGATGALSVFAGTGGSTSSGDGGLAVDASLVNVYSIAVHRETGDVYFTDTSAHTIRKVSYATGIITRVAGTIATAGYSGDGGDALLAKFNGPQGLCVTADGSGLLISDTNNHVVRLLDLSTGIISRYAGTGVGAFAGDGGPRTSAQINKPVQLDVHVASGIVYIADQSNGRIRMVTPDGVISTLAGSGGGSATAGSHASIAAGIISSPVSVRVDQFTGDLYVADSGLNRISRISGFSKRATVVVPGNSGSYDSEISMWNTSVITCCGGKLYDIALSQNSSRHIYWVDNESGKGGLRVLYHTPHYLRNDPNGTITTFPNATMLPSATIGSTLNQGQYAFQPSMPQSIAISPSTGDVYVSSKGDAVVYKVRRWIGTVSIFAGRVGFNQGSGDSGPATSATIANPISLAVHPLTDDVYIGDDTKCVIRKVEQATGIITTFAGTADACSSTGTTINKPRSLAISPDGLHLYVAEYSGNCVRKISFADPSTITNVAGVCGSINGNTANFIQATGAFLNQPWGLAFSKNGEVLYIAEYSSHVVRAVNMSTGIITLVAGTLNTYGFLGDPMSKLNFPTSLATSSRTGDLYICDAENYRVRRISATTGKISSVVGSGTTGYSGDQFGATSAQIRCTALAVSDAHLLIADYPGNRVRAVSMQGQYVDPCPAGSYNDPATQGLTCSPCPAGTARSGSLWTCPDGFYGTCSTISYPDTRYVSGGSCDACGLATYQNNTGASTCQNCPAMDLITTIGAANSSQCVRMSPGYMRSIIMPDSVYQNPAGVRVSPVTGDVWISGNNLYPGNLNGFSFAGTLKTTFNGGTGFGAPTGRLHIDPVKGDVIAYDGSTKKVALGSSTVVTMSVSNGAYWLFPLCISRDGGTWYTNGYYRTLGSSTLQHTVDAYNMYEPLLTLPWYQPTTLAGVGTAGYQDGPASSALFNGINDIALGAYGQNVLYINDGSNNRIRVLNMATNMVSTLAGNGQSADYPTCNQCQATQTPVTSSSMAVHPVSGDLYLSASSIANYGIWKINVQTGIITRVGGGQGWTAGSGALPVGYVNMATTGISPYSMSFIANTGDMVFANSDKFGLMRSLEIQPGESCQPGTYYNRNSGQCVTCPPGTYSSLAGTLDQCNLCPRGKASTATGATSINTCTSCPAGSSTSAVASTACTQCLPGTYTASGAGSELCTECPLSTYGNASGATSQASACFSCPSWLEQTTLSTGGGSLASCVAIPDGTVKTFPTATATFNNLQGIAMSKKTGHVYVTESGIRQITRVHAVTKARTIFAGTGGAACPVNGTLATATTINSIYGVAVHPVTDDVYYADAGCHRIYRISTTTGIITVAAGTGTAGTTGDGGVATSANIYVGATGIDFSPDGRYMYITQPLCIRMVDLQNNSVISTYAGNCASQYWCSATGCPGDNEVAEAGNTLKTRFYGLSMVTVSPIDGSIFISDNNWVRKIDAATKVITSIVQITGAVRVAVSPITGDLAVTGSNQVYTISGRWTLLTPPVKIFAGSDAGGGTGDSGPASAAFLNNPRDIFYAANGDLYIADNSAQRIKLIFGHGKSKYPNWSVTGIPRLSRLRLYDVATEDVACAPLSLGGACYFSTYSAVFKLEYNPETNPVVFKKTLFLGQTTNWVTSASACQAQFPRPASSTLLWGQRGDGSYTPTLAVHPITGDLYIADENCGKIIMVNVTTNNASLLITTGTSYTAYDIAFNKDGSILHVGTGAGQFLRVNMTTRVASVVPGGSSFAAVPKYITTSKRSGDSFFAINKDIYRYQPSTGSLAVYSSTPTVTTGIAEDPSTGILYGIDANLQEWYSFVNVSGIVTRTRMTAPVTGMGGYLSGMDFHARGDLMMAAYGGLYTMVLNDQPFEEAAEPTAPYYDAPAGITYDSTQLYVETRSSIAANLTSPRGMVVIPGTSMLLVADAGSQVIWAVNMHTQEKYLVAGNESSRKDCYATAINSTSVDPTCSSRDGVGAEAEFASPYSVKLHDLDPRYALVADTVNGAIRVIDLYTKEVWTALRNVGFPTDVVSVGERVFITDALNHVVLEYTSASLAALQAKNLWDLSDAKLRVLTGGAGLGMPGMYAEGTAAQAKFWEPLGIAYDSLRHQLYVADYRNRAIRQVHPDTGATSLLLGNPLVPGAYLDGNSSIAGMALVTGPTSLVYDGAEDALLFSDRQVATDPDDDTGAIRKLQLGSTRMVETVVGKLTRRQGDGTVDAPLVSDSWPGSCEYTDVLSPYTCCLFVA